MRSESGATDMQHNRYQKKLAVIVSADVAGYARLTELNEIDVHSHLKRRLQIIEETVSRHNGEVIRIHGDGCLCSFTSIIDALNNCIDIQQNSILSNSNLPQHSQIHFRIGIHLSEVIFDQEPYGNGVNIAVRLQQNAAPDEILVSRETLQSIDHLQGFQFSKPKKLSLKNISTPIYTYKLLGANLNTSSASFRHQNNFASRSAFYAIAFFGMLAMNILLGSHLLIDQNDRQDHAILNDNNIKSEQIFEYFPVADFIVSQSNHPKPDNNKFDPKLTQTVEQLSVLSKQIDNIQQQLNFMRSDSISEKHNINQQMILTTSILSKQGEFIESLLEKQKNNHFLLSNYPQTQAFGYSYTDDNYSGIFSTNHVISSIDSLDTMPDKHNDQFTHKPDRDEIFGCLSCAHPQPANKKTNDSITIKKNNRTAILIGKVNSEGISPFNIKPGVLEDFMYTKVQHSISQSRLGSKITKYSRLTNTDIDSSDNDSLAELCESPDVILVASYELRNSYWDVDGTHLRFHHCHSNKSIVHLERNLAPTIHNVQKPYLTQDSLLRVDKSVDYMIDKLVINEYEEL